MRIWAPALGRPSARQGCILWVGTFSHLHQGSQHRSPEKQRHVTTPPAAISGAQSQNRSQTIRSKRRMRRAVGPASTGCSKPALRSVVTEEMGSNFSLGQARSPVAGYVCLNRQRRRRKRDRPRGKFRRPGQFSTACGGRCHTSTMAWAASRAADIHAPGGAGVIFGYEPISFSDDA